jgi:cellulose synthase operon protein C
LLHEAATTTTLENEPRALDLLRLQLEVAIARSDLREEALARIRLAEIDVNASPDRRANNASAAARALLSLGEVPRARELAWRAARAAPGDVAIAGLLVELEFGAGSRTRNAASAEDGELLGLLMTIPHSATAAADALAMVAFARAELLDLARGAGAGYQDLNAWPEEVRARAPVQLALAERLAAEWSFAAAAVAYERAFSGDLRGLRSIGPSALAAADAAARSNDATRAKTFLDLAARDPSCRIDARRRAVELARAIGDFDGALRALERLAAEGTGNVRAQALADQARLLQSKDPEAAAESLRLAVAASEEGTPLRDELTRERAALEGVRASRSLPPAPPPSLRDSGITSNRAASQFEKALSMMGAPAEEQAPPPAWIAPQSESEPPPRTPPQQQEPTPVVAVAAPPVPDSIPPDVDDEPKSKLSEHPRLTMVGDAPGSPYRPRSMPALPRPAGVSGALDLETLDKIALDPSAPLADRVRALKTLGEAAHEGSREDEATRHFISALELGDIAAGDQAAELLALMPGRGNDLLLVRRRQAFLAPGDRTLLDALHHAALSVRDLVFARAIDHVRRAFDPVAGPVPPPPLDAQLDRPDLVVPLLERRANAVAAEALRLTWEHANAAFRRSAAIPTGVERVTGAIPIGRTVMAAGRLLGAARTPVFVRSRSGRDVEVVLATPPALLLGGDCREDTADVRYVLGAGMIAAHPSHCLLLAQTEDAARGTWQALLSAFGPPDHGRSASPDASRLAATLWQSIPRAAQRRLGELLGQSPPAFEAALEGARQVARRGGLYLSGDLGAAVRTTLAEIGEAQVVSGSSPDLASICQQHSKVADLFRLATSPEFAEARWRVPGGIRRGPSSGGAPGV